jgi:deoxyribodipyrimidine photo-lyase
MSEPFPPTLQAARARIAAVQPAAYARSRNHLGGAVTRLSPYLTHGFVTLPEVLQAVAARQALPLQHKLVQEFAWRAYFHHVWRHRGEAIFSSLHDGPRAEAAYRTDLPDDIRQARTGVPVVDAAVRTLYATGWLHNHARMWLASYVVHLRGVHWRAGADWLVAHLLDGDLASNHLSWQWIAGTGSHKPYLFNADNVARFTDGGAFGDWASPGSVLDTGYDTLERWAQGQPPPPNPLPARPRSDGAGATHGVAEPVCWHRPPDDLPAPAALPAVPALAGRVVWLVHPWALGDPPAEAGVLRLGVWPAECHARWPWRAARWRFVAQRMAAITDTQVWVDSAALQQALSGAASVRCIDNPHLPAAWPAAWRQPPAPWLPEPARLCGSFSQYWRQATRGLQHLQDLPGWPAAAQMPLFEP